MVYWTIVRSIVLPGTTPERVPTLLLTNVPEQTTREELVELLAAAGRTPSEAGYAWGNHDLVEGEVPGGSPERLSWEQLLETQEIRLTIRIPRADHAELRRMAESHGVSLNREVITIFEDAIRQWRDARLRRGGSP